MKRLYISLLLVFSLFCTHHASAQRSIEFGYGKQIFKSSNGLGYIPELKGMNYNGGYLAFKYTMPLRKTPDYPLAVQIGVKYDFQIGKSSEVRGIHTEHYVELPVLLHFIVKDNESDLTLRFFVGPAFDYNLSSRLKIESSLAKPTVITTLQEKYGYTDIDVKACVGVAFNLTDYVEIRATYNFGLSNRRGMIDHEYHTPTSKLYRLNSDILNIGFVYYL